MALGTSRPRNWGKESQQIALDLLMLRNHVAYKTRPQGGTATLRKRSLWLTPSRDGTTLPFAESCCTLIHIRRGHWEARHPYDDRLLATGISERDVIRATILAVWH